MTKIVFMGTPEFSVPILKGLLEFGYEILAVVTQPDRPVGRKKILLPSPVKVLSLENSLSVFQPEKITASPYEEQIIALNPDLIITAAFGQFLSERLLHSPKNGALNVHASLLPKNRGGSPVHSAIINGEKETGVTIMEMVKKMDAGDIIARSAIPIEDVDNVGTMFEKLSLLGRDLLLETLPKYLNQEIVPVKQEASQVTFSPNITREDEKIDWQKSAREIFNQVRGMYPWPIAYTTYQGTILKVLEVKVLRGEIMGVAKAPGVIVKRTKKELGVVCGDEGIVQLLKVQPAGKKSLKIVDFLNGVGKEFAKGSLLGDTKNE